MTNRFMLPNTFVFLGTTNKIQNEYGELISSVLEFYETINYEDFHKLKIDKKKLKNKILFIRKQDSKKKLIHKLNGIESHIISFNKNIEDKHIDHYISLKKDDVPYQLKTFIIGSRFKTYGNPINDFL